MKIYSGLLQHRTLIILNYVHLYSLKQSLVVCLLLSFPHRLRGPVRSGPDERQGCSKRSSTFTLQWLVKCSGLEKPSKWRLFFFFPAVHTSLSRKIGGKMIVSCIWQTFLMHCCGVDSSLSYTCRPFIYIYLFRDIFDFFTLQIILRL